MPEYSGWKKIDKVTIVYSSKDSENFNGVAYPKAFVVETGNKNQMSTAEQWACGYVWDEDSKKYIPTDTKKIETENCGFSFQIVSSAVGSSQGGKLSFWMCLIEKDGVDPFVVGINSYLLCDFILETNLINGKSCRDVMFARNMSNLGVLHEDMKSYKELIKDEQIKKDMKKGKTTKWRVGYEYNTLTCSDIMYGWFSGVARIDAEYESYDSWNKRLLTNIDFTVGKYPVYYPAYSEKSFSPEAILFAIKYGSINKKCPSRQEGKMVFKESDDYYKNIVEILVKDSACFEEHDARYAYNKVIDVLRYCFKTFDYDNDATISMLENMYEYYKKYSLLCPYFSDTKSFDVTWRSGNEISMHEVVYSWDDYFKLLIKITKMEIEKRNGKTACG